MGGIINIKKLPIPDKVIIDSINSDVIIKDTEYSPESNMPYLELSATQIVNRTNIEDIKEEKENMEIEFNNGNSVKITTENDTGSSFANNNIDIAKLYPKFTNSDKLIPFIDTLPTISPFAIGKSWSKYIFELKLMRSMFLSNFGVKKVVFNGPATNITWLDGTTTVVKKAEDDPDDKETAIAYAYLKRLYSLIGIKDMDKHLSKLVKEGKENEASIKEKREKRAKKKALAKKKADTKTETKKPAKPKKENK